MKSPRALTVLDEVKLEKSLVIFLTTQLGVGIRVT